MDASVEALRRLIDSTPGGHKAVALKAGLNPASVDQVYKGVRLPSGNPKGVGPEMRRKLDASFPGWLVVTSESPNEVAATLTVQHGVAPYSDFRIAQYDTGGRMGNSGLVLRDQPGEIRSWSVTSEWLRKNVPNCTAPSNLAIVTGFGDSMRPLYNPGDPLLVDTGVRSVDFDAIYFFRVGDEGFIKRLQRIPGNGLLAISDNDKYRDWPVTKDMDFEVFGRVIKVWKGDDF